MRYRVAPYPESIYWLHAAFSFPLGVPPFPLATQQRLYRDRVARTEPLLEPLANPVTFSVSQALDVALTEPHLGKMMTWSGQV